VHAGERLWRSLCTPRTRQTILSKRSHAHHLSTCSLQLTDAKTLVLLACDVHPLHTASRSGRALCGAMLRAYQTCTSALAVTIICCPCNQGCFTACCNLSRTLGAPVKLRQASLTPRPKHPGISISHLSVEPCSVAFHVQRHADRRARCRM
jgi:hypothetical protein